MKTNDLIAILAATQAPVDSGFLRRMTIIAAAGGLALTMLLVLAILGLRPDLAEAVRHLPLFGKAAFGAGLAGVALLVFLQSLRPGRDARGQAGLLAIPFALLAAWAASTLAAAPLAQWGAITLGRNWLACLVALPLYSLVPFAAMIAVARQGAAVDGQLTGLAAGLASAGLAAMAYSLHCTDDAAPFVAAWYGLGTLAIAIVGMIVTPRLVRW